MPAHSGTFQQIPAYSGHTGICPSYSHIPAPTTVHHCIIISLQYFIYHSTSCICGRLHYILLCIASCIADCCIASYIFCTTPRNIPLGIKLHDYISLQYIIHYITSHSITTLHDALHSILPHCTYIATEKRERERCIDTKTHRHINTHRQIDRRIDIDKCTYSKQTDD